ncbi:MAG: hypothetical protein ACI9R3_000802 [Verrucomicrobiales bacterium]
MIFLFCIIAFYTFEHWRGKRKWDAFRTEWEVKGERFEAPEITAIPDEQNAAMVPIMAELTEIWREHPDWFRQTRHPEVQDRGRLHHFAEMVTVTPTLKSRTDMEECRRSQRSGGVWEATGEILPLDEAEAAREIIARFNTFSGILEEVDAMLQERPTIALPTKDRNDPHAITAPHADVFFKLSRALHWKALAHIHLGDGTAAFTDLERSSKIGTLLETDRVDNFRSLQTCTIRFGTMIPAVWEGLYANAWNAGELEKLQQIVDAVDFAPGVLSYLRFSRWLDIEASTSAKVRSLHNSKLEVFNARFNKGRGSRGYSRLEFLRPQGWRYQSLTNRLSDWQEAVFTRKDGSVNHDEITVEMVEASNLLGVSNFEYRELDPVRRAAKAIADKIGVNYDPQPVKMGQNLPELGTAAPFLIESYAFARTVQQHLCATAIALERFQFQHGSYPESLIQLVPDFLSEAPVDPWHGEALLHYSIRPGGLPALWSIGENRTDENGFLGNHGTGDDILWHYAISPDEPEHPHKIAKREAKRAKRTSARKRRKAE